MPTQGDVRRIALSLPDAVASDTDFSFRVNDRLFVWAWLERLDPRKVRVPSTQVVVVRVRDEMDKQTLLGVGDPALFTEPHFDGYACVLVRLADADPAFLEGLITDSYDLEAAKPPPKPRRRRVTD